MPVNIPGYVLYLFGVQDLAVAICILEIIALLIFSSYIFLFFLNV